MLKSGDHVILAVSGGVDSMVMLDILAKLQKPLRLKLTVAHVNYRLREKASEKDELFVKSAAERYNIPLYIKRSNTEKIAKAGKRSIQETARDLRYSFFDTLKEKLAADVIATAHHSDDNMETVLINLLRGGGIDGLAGIPLQRDSIVRPFLSADRNDILLYAKANSITFRKDSSNAKNDYTRNFLRNLIIPKLQKRINPSLNETIRQGSSVLRSVSEYLELETDRAFKKIVSSNGLELTPLKQYHQVIQQSVIRRLLKDLTIEPTFTKIVSIQKMQELQKGSIVQLQNGWTAERLSNRIILNQKQKEVPFKGFSIQKEGTYSTAQFVLTVTKSEVPDNKKRPNPSEEYVDAAVLSFPLKVRAWQSGDSFQPIGMKGKKKLSDFFGGLKLSQDEKKQIPVLECSGEIMWVAGKRLDDRFKITDSTTSTYHLTIQFK